MFEKSLKLRFVLISIITSIVIGGAVYIASAINQLETEQRYTELLLNGESVLWDKTVSSALSKLKLHAHTLKQEKQILRLMLNEIEHKKSSGWSLQSVAKDWFEFSKDKVFTRLQLLSLKGELLYTSDSSLKSSNLKALSIEVLNTQKQLTGLFIDNESKLVALSIVPMIYDDEVIGAGVIESDLSEPLAIFSQQNDSVILLKSERGDIQYVGNAALFKAADLSSLSRDEISTVKYQDKIYSLSYLPVKAGDGEILGRIYSARDTTDVYQARLNRQVISLSIIVAGLFMAAIFLRFFMDRSFKPVDDLLDTVKQLSAGNITARAKVQNEDEIGRLASVFNDMAQSLQDNLEAERLQAETLRKEVDEILLAVNRAAEGDLTVKMKSSGDGRIADLNNGIQRMLDNLNQLVRKVQKGSLQLSTSVSQISATAREQEVTIAEQAASTSQVMTSINKISSISRDLFASMETINEATEHTQVSAAEGKSALVDMEHTMHNMEQATGNIASKLAILNEKANNINNVVVTINRVADQTNLLSLNAAIEAEKAGEYGRGFSVVATEIRRLADQTAVATWDIEQTIKEILSAVSAGVMGMETFSQEVSRNVESVVDVGAKLNSIIEQVQVLPSQFDMVTENMQSQTHRADQIVDSINQLNETAQNTVESIAQSNQSITLLKTAAHVLQESISIFKIEDSD